MKVCMLVFTCVSTPLHTASHRVTSAEGGGYERPVFLRCLIYTTLRHYSGHPTVYTVRRLQGPVLLLSELALGRFLPWEGGGASVGGHRASEQRVGACASSPSSSPSSSLLSSPSSSPSSSLSSSQPHSYCCCCYYCYYCCCCCCCCCCCSAAAAAAAAALRGAAAAGDLAAIFSLLMPPVARCCRLAGRRGGRQEVRVAAEHHRLPVLLGPAERGVRHQVHPTQGAHWQGWHRRPELQGRLGDRRLPALSRWRSAEIVSGCAERARSALCLPACSRSR